MLELNFRGMLQELENVFSLSEQGKYGFLSGLDRLLYEEKSYRNIKSIKNV